jgi:hypothetical protein
MTQKSLCRQAFSAVRDARPALQIEHVDPSLAQCRSRFAEAAADVRRGGDVIAPSGLGGGGHDRILSSTKESSTRFPEVCRLGRWRGGENTGKST